MGFYASHDMNNNAGYGITKEKFHTQRSMGNIWPYTDTDDDESLIDDVEFDILNQLMTIINSNIHTNDFLKKNSDPFFFASGNIGMKVTEGKITNSISPMPWNYKNRGPQLNGTQDSVTAIQQYSSNIIPISNELDEIYDDDDLINMISYHDIENDIVPLVKARWNSFKNNYI